MTQPKTITTATSTSTSFLDGLRGIRPPRNINDREQGNLERLVETVKQAVEKFAGQTKDKDNWQLNNCYLSIYNYLIQSLNDLDFSEKDLSSLVIGISGSTNYDNNQQRVAGMCTGALLQIFTEANEKQGKGTTFYVNGKGSKFDYLFFYSKKVDTLIVENFKGNNICSLIGSYDGKANLVITNNIIGNEALWDAGSWEGGVSVAIANNIIGDWTLWDAGGYSGSVGVAIANNIVGDNTLILAGGYGGGVGAIIANNITGNSPLGGVGSVGNVDAVYYYNTPGISWDRISSLDKIKSGKIISGEQAVKEYQEITNQCKVNEFLALTNSLEGKTGEEIAGITEQFKSLMAQIPEKYFRKIK